MRLAVFSDIHGNLIAFEAAWRDCESLGGADMTWFLGDLAAFGSRPAECLQRVKAIWEAGQPPKPEGDNPDGIPAPPAKEPPKVRAIRGNTDRYLVSGSRPRATPAEKAEDLPALVSGVRDRDLNLNWCLAQLGFDEYDFLRKLGGECELHVPGFGFVIGYHGTPGDDEGVLMPDSTDEEAADALLDREGRLGIGGHIHRQMDRTLARGYGWRVVNVGSVGMSFERPGFAQWGLFTFDGDHVTVDLRAVPYDVDAYRAELESCGMPVPSWTTSKLTEPQR
jgi:predicted phosphodiesterase